MGVPFHREKTGTPTYGNGRPSTDPAGVRMMAQKMITNSGPIDVSQSLTIKFLPIASKASSLARVLRPNFHCEYSRSL